MSTKSVHGRWEAKFTKLQGWFEAHGRLPLRGSGSADEVPLSSWIAPVCHRASMTAYCFARGFDADRWP